MKKTELIIGITSIIALVTNYLLVLGGNIFTVLSLSSLSMLYFSLSFVLFNNIQFRSVFKRSSYKDISTARVIGSIATGFALSLTTIGILFKFQFLAGATLTLIEGLIGISIALIISTIKYFTTKDLFYVRVLKRLIIIGGLGLILLLLPKGFLVDLKYRNHPEYAKALKNILNDPLNKDFQDQLSVEREKMHNE